MWFPRSFADLRVVDIRAIIEQTFWIPKPTWTVDDIPDLTGKVVIVTGGNSGIGKETVKALLSHNARVYMLCRTAEKTERAIEDLERVTGKKAIHLHMDLSSMKSVKEGVSEFLGKEKELHLLINNAGVMFPPHSQLAEGYDLQFHTNVTGHWYLTSLLLPILLETAKHSAPKSVRVVHVASMGHYAAKSQPLDFGSFKAGPQRNKYRTDELYLQSKFGNIVVSNEFHRRFAEQGLVSIATNPGNINTELYRYVDTNPIIWFGKKLAGLYPPSSGAITQLYAGVSEEAGNYGGKFLIPWARLGKPRPETGDVQLGKELWTWLEEQVTNI
ncbi:NAD(P)-binding protein [Macrolepiota fuliginosa MF-IS2]|uniref:NAD(P)-binding protein n=1 Tax=Macrolepiota fuliginosa MF-IS2 TaxID=1400762 RepID=A0A9P5XPR9_9AGAR|nr:NAD(P)-binding protein [Macrolepiota fuliginosa MF-IS2]